MVLSSNGSDVSPPPPKGVSYNDESVKAKDKKCIY